MKISKGYIESAIDGERFERTEKVIEKLRDKAREAPANADVFCARDLLGGR